MQSRHGDTAEFAEPAPRGRFILVSGLVYFSGDFRQRAQPLHLLKSPARNALLEFLQAQNPFLGEMRSGVSVGRGGLLVQVTANRPISRHGEPLVLTAQRVSPRS